MEPNPKEGTITVAEHCIRTSVRTAMEKISTERKEKEDKFTTNKYETLDSQVERLSEEVVGQKTGIMEAQQALWLLLLVGEHKQLRCPRDAEHFHTDSRRTERLGRGLEKHPWNWDHDG